MKNEIELPNYFEIEPSLIVCPLLLRLSIFSPICDHSNSHQSTYPTLQVVYNYVHFPFILNFFFGQVFSHASFLTRLSVSLNRLNAISFHTSFILYSFVGSQVYCFWKSLKIINTSCIYGIEKNNIQQHQYNLPQISPTVFPYL